MAVFTVTLAGRDDELGVAFTATGEAATPAEALAAAIAEVSTQKLTREAEADAIESALGAVLAPGAFSGVGQA